MEAQFTGKNGISGYTGNYSITTFTCFTSFAVKSGNTRKYGITRTGNCKMLELFLNTADN
jgi:hypothetical protein